MKIPIIFICRGDPPYLKYALLQARKSNPGTDIYLLGDEANNKYDFVKHHFFKEYFKKADAFRSVYNHISVNDLEFELFCFQRWFILSEFINRLGIGAFFSCDCDVMVYCDVNELWTALEGIDFTVLESEEWSSVHASFWTGKVVNGFCDFIMDFYLQKKYKNINTRFPTGTGMPHFSDMYAMHMYARATPFKYKDTKERIASSVFNDVVNELQIRWRNGVPYDRFTGARYAVLHFQEWRKTHIKMYYLFSGFPVVLQAYFLVVRIRQGIALNLKLLFSGRKGMLKQPS